MKDGAQPLREEVAEDTMLTELLLCTKTKTPKMSAGTTACMETIERMEITACVEATSSTEHAGGVEALALEEPA